MQKKINLLNLITYEIQFMKENRNKKIKKIV